MNTPNINSSNAGDPIGKTRGVEPSRKTVRNEGAGLEQDAARIVPDNGSATQDTVRPATDTFRTTRDREFVNSMITAAENEEPPVREEAVNRARNRIREGYYNTPDFIGTLATRLINTDFNG